MGATYYVSQPMGLLLLGARYPATASYSHKFLEHGPRAGGRRVERDADQRRTVHGTALARAVYLSREPPAPRNALFTPRKPFSFSYSSSALRAGGRMAVSPRTRGGARMVPRHFFLSLSPMDVK